MTTIVNKLLAAAAGAVALCAAALPAAAAPWTQAGASMGAAAGAAPPPGLYFIGAANYGVAEKSPTTAVGVGVQALLWVPGWTFLGATYSASAALIEVEVGVHNANYLRGVYNPSVTPISLSWNLGNGFFASLSESIYLPINTDITFSTPGVTSGAAFEQKAALSYINSDWIASINAIYGIVTADAVGNKEPDYLNVDFTLLRQFGKWRIGPVAYISLDTETTVQNAAVGKGFAAGVGGALGYNFGPVDLSFVVSHQVDTHGDTSYQRGDTRAWVTLFIPIWNPTPAAPKPLVAKY